MNKPEIVLTFASKGYFELAHNWAEGMKRIGRGKDYVVVALDEETNEFLNEKKINNIFIPLEGNIWTFRLEILNTILEKDGIICYHSDVDAFWKQDAIIRTAPFFKKADVVASQGTYFPKNVWEKSKFVLCCGFYAVRSTHDTRKLFKEVFLECQKVQDDQVAMNNLITKKVEQWEGITNPVKLSYNDRPFLTSDTTFYGECDNVRVAVLPHKEYQRRPNESDDIVIFHPVLDIDTVELFKKHNCYVL